MRLGAELPAWPRTVPILNECGRISSAATGAAVAAATVTGAAEAVATVAETAVAAATVAEVAVAAVRSLC